ncbi:MAG: YihY/virulence factor BrkB family protein [Verrucomicrobiota bacterium]
MPLTAASEKPDATPSDAHERGRGRNATSPTEVPKEGWLDVLSRTWQQLNEDNLSVVAAGVAFYGFLAVVPALAATVAIYGLIADPAQVTDQVTALARIVPGEALPLLRDQMIRITSDTQAAGWSAVLGVALALFSTANAVKAMISGLNISYDEIEKRSFIKLTALAILLTVCAIVGAVLAISLVAVMPSVLQRLHISGSAETFLNFARWPLLVGCFMGSLAVIYRYGPCRHDAKWKWVSPGAIVASVLWLIGSALFSLYVTHIGGYDKTYGPLGAVVVFLMWLYVSAFVVLIGAELNSELERQTKRDTTEGPEKPLGERRAKAADTVGPARHKMPEPETK